MRTSFKFSWRFAFTIAEFLIVISIVILLAVMVFAPYSYYSDSAKLRISVSKIEQVFTQAKIESSMGIVFPGTDHNADVYITLLQGAPEIPVTTAISGSGLVPASDQKPLRTVALEKGIVVDISPKSSVIIVCRAPIGKCESYSPDGSVLNFTGWVVWFMNADRQIPSTSREFHFQTFR